MSHRPKVADPIEVKWPVVDTDKEKAVLEIIENVFSKYQSCLRTIKKPPKWKKNADGEKEDSLSKEDEKMRKQFKSWFVVGVQTVMRNLERDKLSAVLLWTDMQPAVLRKALLHLVSQHSCPAICVSDLLASLQKSWPGLTSAAALGVLVTEEPNDFKDLVEYVRTNAPQVIEHSVREEKVSVVPLSNFVQSEDRPTAANIQTSDVKISTDVKKYSKNLSRPKVDATKYYVYKAEENESKSFSGQSFIAFDDGPHCITVETVNGKRNPDESRVYKKPITFGIRPSLEETFIIKGTGKNHRDVTDKTKNTKGDSEKDFNNRKRKMMDDRNEYKGINVKKFQKNMQKKKKLKNKKKK